MAEKIVTVSPTTGEPLLERAGISAADAAKLPVTAAEAFQTWRTTTLAERKAIVRKALDLLSAQTDALARELTEQMGRPIAYTPKEIATAVKRAEFFLRVCDDVLKDTPGEAEAGYERFIRKVPVGPVLVIFAWNYPYLILVNTLIPALLAGNTVILKPAPQTPTVVEHVAAAFQEAGLPEGVLQYFHSSTPAVIESVVTHPLVEAVSFTGSVAVGLAVQKAAAAADRIVHVGLELGGKDPAYVRPDVDVAWAAEQIVDGCVFNSGQSCCALERVYVHADVHDAFVAAAQKVLAGYVLGDPADKGTHVGPVVTARAKTTIEAHIADALAKGAVDATPANASFAAAVAAATTGSGSSSSKGHFVKPTLLTNVTHDMTVMRDETFGPVMPVMRVADDAEALRLMNDSAFGLTASVWTKDRAAATKLVDALEAGTVFVNRCDYPSPDLAWTGWKNSGKGHTLSRFGFDQFVKLKSYHLAEGPA